ncbi:MAG: CTP synthetase [Pikeienuella sp.]
MFRLAALIYAMTGPTLAGILIVAALVTGLDTLRPILIAAAVGFVVAIPLAWVITKELMRPKV